MHALKTVVGYDGSDESRAALHWALDDARRTGAAVELVHACTWPALMPAASMIPATSVWPDGEALEALRELLDAAVAGARATHPEVPVTQAFIRGPAALVLVERAAHATQLVVGGRGHSAVAGILIGSVSSAVATHAPCPVVVVRDRPDGEDHRPVVVGLDESSCAEVAAGFAFDQAAARGAAVHAVRAWMPPPDPWIGPPVPDREEVSAAERRALTDQLAGWRDKFPAVAVTADVVVGHPARVLTDASRDAQLIVVGSRGRGGFRSLLLGSVSRHLLQHSRCTVAVARDLPGQGRAER
ncbi:universal stress protein [Spirilliplanes yamanashiensis]|uniref:Universal stress protein n=1 Tax=Spirilliplanes yamanashiensis TaxID=42233 RepID=A0A8J3YF28_9ACTN|nr:universal stress protein [Spirilliplanes yamanashiensis]MDP9818214.1 nucleotide-binding universal stress UspA family protein [Spirilliplanes yamanashiensis]GIJ06759.1 universal stress protein [Spirilliplanes yamanashiensis]